MKSLITLLAIVPTLLTAQVKLSERLTTISEHLGEGGAHFSVTDSEGDIENLLSMIGSLLQNFPDQTFPPNLDLAEAGRHLGIYEILGSGSSSAETDTHWHNRSFALTSGKHNGLLSLLGQKSQAHVAPTFAPQGTDLLLETSLDLRQIEKVSKTIAASFGQQPADLVSESFAQQISETLTLSDLLGDMNVRFSFALWMNDDNKAELAQDLHVPAPHLAIRIDNAATLWKFFKPQIEGGSEIVEKENITSYLSPKEDSPWGPMQPLVAWDKNTNTLWAALRPEDLELAWSDGKKLTTDPSYLAAHSGLPKTTNSNAFISQAGLRLISQASTILTQLAEDDEAPTLFMVNMLTAAFDQADSPHGYAGAVSILENGILITNNAPLPNKGSSAAGPGQVGMIAVLAGLATPAILKAKKNADKAQQINNIKQLNNAILEYDAEFDSYPAKLTNLLSEKIIEPHQYQQLVHPDLVYRGSKVGGGNLAKSTDIIMYLKIEDLGDALIGRADGSVKVIPINQLQQRLAK